MSFQIVHNDITKMHTDAIVNAANTQLLMGGGVCGAVFSAAGPDKLERECRRLAPCPVGRAVITGGYGLHARYVIHAVGPVWRGGGQGERELLAGAYLSALELARERGCRSVAFPLISSGIYGYPKSEALQVAVDTIREFLNREELDVYLVVFDRRAVELGQELYADLRHFIDRYFEENPARRLAAEPFACEEAVLEYEGPFSHQKYGKRSLEDMLNNLDETFSQMVLRLIDQKGYRDVEVYKRANMDRKLFSKIRSNPQYSPKKQTVLALAIALRLNVDEARDLLKKAGFTLSDSQKQDVIIRYFLEAEEYDMFTINEALFCFEQPLLA